MSLHYDIFSYMESNGLFDSLRGYVDAANAIGVPVRRSVVYTHYWREIWVPYPDFGCIVWKHYNGGMQRTIWDDGPQKWTRDEKGKFTRVHGSESTIEYPPYDTFRRTCAMGSINIVPWLYPHNIIESPYLSYYAIQDHDNYNYNYITRNYDEILIRLPDQPQQIDEQIEEPVKKVRSHKKRPHKVRPHKVRPQKLQCQRTNKKWNIHQPRRGY